MSEETWDQMHEADEKGHWASLLALCALHLKNNPDHLQARIPQAIALRNLKRFQEAVTVLEQTYANSGASEKCKYQCQRELGDTLEEMGKFDDARRAYDEAHRLAPTDAIIIIYRGVMELGRGEFVAAREWLNRALECPEGDFDEAHFNIGSSYLCEGNYARAIEHYQKAITLDPDYDVAWRCLEDAKRALEIREQSE
jgi:tetratricopeptide (TPR) repeat protein